MKLPVLVMAWMVIGCTAAHPAAADTGAANSRLEPMPKSLEIRFALSALPQPLRADATVYVLDPSKGYFIEHAGTNGQSCLVSRTEWKFADYRDDIFDATCYDRVGAQNHLQVLLEVARLRASGVPPTILKQRIQAAFDAGTYRAPVGAGFSYMTAPLMRTYVSLDPNDKGTVMTMSMPHVMYYAPNVTDKQIGGLGCPPCAPYPFAFETGPHGYIIQRLGEAETERIVADESALVRDLCDFRRELCLSPPQGAAP